jgi:hypothetical protein
VPAFIYDRISERIDRCWRNLDTMLDPDGPYLDPAVDDAAHKARACVCKELARILEAGGSWPLVGVPQLPPQLLKWWNQLQCEVVLQHERW